MLYNQNVFRILEIEPTDDKKAIKKAYAKLVKQYHPEEYPEKWKDIHEAYETALKLAERTAFSSNTIHNHTEYVKTEQNLPILQTETEKKPPVPEMKTENIQPAIHTKKESISSSSLTKATITKYEHMQNQDGEDFEKADIDDLFEHIEQLSAEQKKQKEELQKQVTQKVMSQFKVLAKKRRCNREEWEKFFNQSDILPVISTREFLYQLGECFAKRKIDDGMYQLLKGQLQLIEEYHMYKNIVFKDIAFFNPLEYAESKIDAAYKAGLHRGIRIRLENKSLFTTRIFFRIIILGTFLIMGMFLYLNKSVGGEEEYQYLKQVKLKLPYQDTKCKVYIPDGMYQRNADDCASGTLGGICVLVDIVEFSGEESKWMERSVASKYSEYTKNKQDKYQNVSVGEILPMTSFEDAEYIGIYYEYLDVYGDVFPAVDIMGYYVLEESEESIKEVTVSVEISPLEYDETTDEILKELETAYGMDLHEYYSCNFEARSLFQTEANAVVTIN